MMIRMGKKQNECFLTIQDLRITKFALGNAIYGYSDTDDKKWLQVSLVVSNDDQDKSTYCLGKIALKEQFINKPHFKTEGSVLSWDRGYGFIGDITGEKFINTFFCQHFAFFVSVNVFTIICCFFQSGIFSL